MGDFLIGVFLAGIALALGVSVGSRNFIDVERIEWAYKVCESNDGLESTNGYEAVCVNGAKFIYEN